MLSFLAANRMFLDLVRGFCDPEYARPFVVLAVALQKICSGNLCAEIRSTRRRESRVRRMPSENRISLPPPAIEHVPSRYHVGGFAAPSTPTTVQNFASATRSGFSFGAANTFGTGASGSSLTAFRTGASEIGRAHV